MLFNSIDFLIFFIVVTASYFVVPHRFRWILLLLASCFFYMAFIPVYILILAITILIDYFAAIAIEKNTGKRRDFFLVLSILSTVFVLFAFKYFNFINGNFAAAAAFLHWNYPIGALSIILPIGLSFHTFQSLSYVVEVYQGRQKVERDFGIYALYVMFYPQLVAGPIERPQNLLHQFYEKHRFHGSDAAAGLKQMLWGMFKKVVVADRLAIYVNMVYADPSHQDGWSLVLATIFFGIQIYCDFSGYSDIAIGAARVMGFRLMTNFNQPYFSRSIPEFWTRWHISLSTWFKDYLYIPLGGNRVPRLVWYRNLFVVFLVSGVWHGANWTYVIWGALHGTYQVFSVVTARIRAKIAHVVFLGNKWVHTFFRMAITFGLVSFAWIFFRAKTTEEAFTIVVRIFSHPGRLSLDNDAKIHVTYGLVAIGILLAVEIRRELGRRGVLTLRTPGALVRQGFYAFLILVMLLMGVYDAGQFIYFQF